MYKFNRKKFISSILGTAPQLANTDLYFYLKPAKHILCGILCEATPNGIYLWEFVYPLFDRKDFIHLTYSQRIKFPEGYIDFEQVNNDTLPSEFWARVGDKFDNLSPYMELDNFYSLLNSNKANDYNQIIMAYTMILLNDSQTAQEHLDIAIQSQQLQKDKALLEECILIRELMASSKLDKAVEIIASWEVQKKQKLKIAA